MSPLQLHDTLYSRINIRHIVELSQLTFSILQYDHSGSSVIIYVHTIQINVQLPR